MNPKIRRLMPLLLALLCWALVALVPGTRNGLQTAWSGRNASLDQTSLFERKQRKQFASDWRVQIDELPLSQKPLQETSAERQWGNNPFVVAMRLRRAVVLLRQQRDGGPLTNPDYPKPIPNRAANGTSPRIEWDKFIALARRGQQMEPNNTFFDWMLLYGLYATHQDEVARRVVLKAALKTSYDDHVRESMINRLKVWHLFYGSPLSPRDQIISAPDETLGCAREVAYWTMENVIADRQSGKDEMALDCATALVKMSRLVRRDSYTLRGSFNGQAWESIALGSVTLPRKAGTKIGAALSLFQINPQMLYFYAKSRKRSDITSFLNAEWIELGRWRKAKWKYEIADWTGNTNAETVSIIFTERLAAIIVRSLPSIVILLSIFCGLSHLFPEERRITIGGFWRGVGWGIWLLTLMMIFDVIITLKSSYLAVVWSFAGFDMLLSVAPSWVKWGIASAIICVAFNAAIAQCKPQIGNRSEKTHSPKKLFATPDGGLTRFDFGPMFSLVMRLTLWIVLFGILFGFCWNQDELYSILKSSADFLPSIIAGSAITTALFLNMVALRSLPPRSQTFRLSFRLAFEAFYGFFVAASLLYALVAFAALTFALQYQRNFEKAIQRGELNILRAKAGL